jgi:hypothetical protein
MDRHAPPGITSLCMDSVVSTNTPLCMLGASPLPNWGLQSLLHTDAPLDTHWATQRCLLACTRPPYPCLQQGAVASCTCCPIGGW